MLVKAAAPRQKLGYLTWSGLLGVPLDRPSGRERSAYCRRRTKTSVGKSLVQLILRDSNLD
jgi:hypothetical protein